MRGCLRPGSGRTVYRCDGAASRAGDGGGGRSVSAAPVDDGGVGRILEVAQPAGVEFGLAGARAAEHQATGLDRSWTLRVERLTCPRSLEHGSLQKNPFASF